MNVLIIEDETFIALDIKAVISTFESSEVFHAKNSDEAIRLFYQHEIDLIISDINLKEAQDGVEVISHILQIKEVPVIFLTSYSDDKTLEQVSKVDFASYMLKPFNEDELLAQIKLVKAKFLNHIARNRIELSEEYSFCKDSDTLYFHDNKIELTKNELLLFKMLLNVLGGSLSYATIDKVIWHNEYVSDSARRQLIHRLKKKLEGLDIVTVTNVGLKLVV
jgi:DNA-binding response OmpR family regulator